ncbi:MAG: hypothetical protein QNJ60_11415 [Xenococcaceae cyanobacterium MO_188.B19]|nr:hypothetical protein [Xenococcaceae cyanobacterium MO_188.B19]MDJ0679442.1 hypothetical protein [Xenococcaceae cyanobacterium MO_167.B52]
MDSTPNSLTSSDHHHKKIPWLRWVKYILLGTLCNAGLFGFTLYYLKKTPSTYTSELIVHVAGSSPGVSVNLPSIGQANTSSGTAFGSHSDPRENYKLMATSSTILDAAASILDIPKAKFGKPIVNLINNTTLLEFKVKAQDPEVAQQKAQAIYQALYNRLEMLRTEEQTERDKAVQKALSDAEAKLTKAQQRISAYKTESGLNSSNQVKNLINNLGSLQIQYIQTAAEYRKISDRLNQQIGTVGIQPQQAADALVLETDQEFQKILANYTNGNTKLIELRGNRGENYPDVVKARNETESSLNALLTRGQLLLGKPVEKLTLELLILDNSNGSGEKRANLFVQIIDLKAEQQGLSGKIENLKDQINRLKNELTILTQKEAVLDTLDRDVQIAQAVFASTLTKIDLSKGDPFASFPMIQVIEHPSLPDEPSAPKPKLIIAGTIMGCLLVSIGLTILWWREPLVKVSRKIMIKIIE